MPSPPAAGRVRWQLLLAAAAGAVAVTATAADSGGLCEAMQRKHAGGLPKSEQEVVDSWVEGYDRLLRPAVAAKGHLLVPPNDWTNLAGRAVDPDNVKIDLYVNSVWDVDQRAGSFKVRAYLRMRWRDERLCFNGSALPPHSAVKRAPNVGGRGPLIELDEDTVLNQSTGVSIFTSIWSPDVHFTNTTELPKDDARLLSVDETGHVFWSRRFIATLSANFDFKYLPFDSQNLSVSLESYRMNTDSVLLQWGRIDGDSCADGDCTDGDSQTGVGNIYNPEWVFKDNNIPGTPCAPEPGLISCAPHGSSGSYWYTTMIKHHYPGIPGAYWRATFTMQVLRQSYMWEISYIFASQLLFFISYMGLYIGNHNPGRPGVHTVTILTHLTIDSSIRAQLPNVSNETWITEFQSTVLYFHVLIFVEYCIVHYAYRQNQKLKKAAERK
eukprot:SAG22_NODE_3047_length_1985_cov_2.118770_2_plen_439_part_01